MIALSLCGCVEARRWIPEPTQAEALGILSLKAHEGPEYILAGAEAGEVEATLMRRYDKIVDELEHLPPDGIWGVYYSDGTILALAPASGVVYSRRWHGALIDANFGSVIHTEDRTLYLDLELDTTSNLTWFQGGIEKPVWPEYSNDAKSGTRITLRAARMRVR